MRFYSQTLKARQHHCQRQHERRWGDPDFRLKMVNYNRARKGLEPLRSVDQIQTRSERVQNRQRDEAGRFA